MANLDGAAAVSLCVENASLRLGRNRVLTNVSIEVRRGGVTAVVGPNGAGKSSLLRLLSGELPPTKGCVRLDGESLDRLAPLEQARRRSVMVQSAGVAFDFLVEEVLEMGWTQGGGYREQRGRAFAEVVSDCGVRALLGRRFNTLSGGERQRVQFTRALLQIWRPQGTARGRYMLLDEPTSSLDLAHELLVLRLARRASANDVGVLAVLHDLNLAARFADRVALLSGGKMVAVGPPSEVFTDATLSRVYRTPVQVEHHEGLDRLVVYA